MSAFASTWLGALGAALGALSASADLHAERLTEANLARLRVPGTDASGGLGDWALGNGTLCAVVSDLAHENAMSARGGALVDLGHCGRGDDQFVVALPTASPPQRGTPPAERIRAAVAGNEARVVVEGERGGLRFETHYAVDRVRPTALRVELRAEREAEAEGEGLSSLGFTTLHPSASLGAFASHTREPEHSRGFAHPSPEEAARSERPHDLHVLVGSPLLGPGIAYGVQLRSARIERAGGERSTPRHVALNGEDYSVFGVVPPGLELGSEAARGFALALGDRLTVEIDVWVGARADVAAVTDQLFARGARVSGRVDDLEALLHVSAGSDGSAAPVTLVRPDPDGSFGFRVPPGSYALRALAPGGRELERSFPVDGADLALPTLALGSAARVRLPRGGPMRLVFEGLGDTPDPRLGDDLLGRRFGEDELYGDVQGNDVSLAGLRDDPASLIVPPGRYRVYATRGPEYGVTQAELEVLPGQEVALAIEAPARALDTPGWISADFHVHSGLSFDSALPPRLRLAAFVAQGAEVLVPSEHDRVVDYAPRIRELGLERLVTSVVGVELTGSVRSEAAPRTIGHSNVFPLPFRPELHNGGAPRGEGVRLRASIAEVRALAGERVFQLNHPRGARVGDVGDGEFLSHLSNGAGFDPTRPLDSGPNAALLERDPASGLRDLDFDAVELMNGGSLAYYRIVRADWFSLLLQGERRTAMANSDSHRISSVVALPRSYVRVPDDRVSGLDEAALVRAVRAGRVFGTTGPIPEVRLGSAEIGDLYAGSSGTLRLGVRAAPWVPISSGRVYVNGVLVAEQPLARERPLEVPLRFEGDSFVTVEIEGEADEVFGAVAPKTVPFAFANPIFVDADEDGDWTAPGLPAELPQTVSAPLGAGKD
jgi:hypothetical protein